MKPVDAHCHLTLDQFNKDREKLIEKTRHHLELIAVPGLDYTSNSEVMNLSRKYNDFIVPNLGLHPTYEESFDQAKRIKEQIKKENPPVIGEIGLDHHHIEDAQTREKQETAFREMLELAEELEKPVVIHSRSAEEKAFKILQEYNLNGIMLHCFNGSTELAKKAASKNMRIGVTTQVLYSDRVQNIVKEISANNMMLETDSPYLYRGDRNQPLNVTESAEKIAELKGIKKQNVIDSTTKNSKQIHLH